ncbi:uncharacterized protein LOC135494128 [Lineus longissimus]|uniref:uncharacterized protein LOC135494128 n=1 Tax=Lineus longissimus TaxID=88925 RepID=UPI002B4F47E8
MHLISFLPHSGNMELYIPSILSYLIVVSIIIKGTVAIKCHSGNEEWNTDGDRTKDTKTRLICPTAITCYRVPTAGYVARGVAHTITFGCGPCDGRLAGCQICGHNYCNGEKGERERNSGHVTRSSLAALLSTFVLCMLLRIGD